MKHTEVSNDKHGQAARLPHADAIPYPPDVAGLVAFVERAFGGIETFRSRGSEGGVHVEVRIGDSMLMIGGKQDSEPLPAMLYLYVDDADVVYRQALAAGGASLMEPAEPGDGDRRAGVQDSFGNQWWIGAHLAVAQDEEARRD